MSVIVQLNDRIATVTLNRPDKKNAISWEMRRQLWEAIEGLAEDDNVRAVILTGAGDDFCSGMDVGEFGRGTLRNSFTRMDRLHRISRAIYKLKKPTIAAVKGVCVGAGWSYALCCDLVLAADTARFSQIFSRTALAPDAGAVWLLSRHTGIMRAKEICYSGRVLGAEEAVTMGLALKEVPSAELLDQAQSLASTMAQGPTLALAMAKRQFEIANMSSFDAFLEAEYAMQPLMMRSEDHQEGVQAFRERRTPSFRGV